MSIPSVSVILPCYQCGEFLEEALTSVGKQTGNFDLLEVILIVDSTPDEKTQRVLGNLATNPVLRVIPNANNQGAAGARNSGIAAAQGEWIAFLDSDDLWTESSLSRRFEVLESFPEAVFVGCDFGYIYADGATDERGFCRTREIPSKTLAEAFERSGPFRLENPLPAFLRAVPTHTDVVLVKRKALLEVGMFDQRLSRAEDIDLWLRLAARHPFHFAPYLGALYRQHPSSLTHADEPPAVWEVQVFQKLIRFAEFKPWTSLMRQRVADYHCQNYWYFRRAGDTYHAALSAMAALRWQPGNMRNIRLLAAALLRG